MNISGTTLLNGRPRRDGSGFTMVEIALCLAVIGVALVAIIGVLPFGMREQQDNRERTVVNQDATVFMEAIRNGSRGADDLTNYVYQIQNIQTPYSPAPGNAATLGYSNFTSGAGIIGLLSTPEFTDKNGLMLPNLSGGGYSNHIVAYVHSLSGPAVEKPPQNNPLLMQDSFTYRVICANVPVQLPTNNPTAYAANLEANLHDLRLTFLWPQLPNGSLGKGKQVYRTLIAGQLSMAATNSPALYFFQPQLFTNAP